MKLCVALDLDSKQGCLDLAKSLKGLDLWLKVGMRSFYRDGAKLISLLKQEGGFKIFLDLKLYDIPNTMLQAINELCLLDIDMINIHASAGFEAMSKIANEFKMKQNPPLLLAVSALTSFNKQDFASIYNQDLSSAVINMSKMSFEAGLDGMVCSVYESMIIKQATSKDFLTLCPGIRPNASENDDQKRVASTRDALKAKADFIVVGRPIIKAANPYNATMMILEEIACY